MSEEMKHKKLNVGCYTDEELDFILSDTKTFLSKVIYTKIESSENHNIFTNYNCLSRDVHIFNETFDQVYELFKELLRERYFFERARNHFSSLYFKEKDNEKK